MVTSAQPIVQGEVATPLGPLHALCTAHGLCRLTFAGETEAARAHWLRRWLPGAQEIADADRRLEALAAQLAAYLEGALRHFTIPLDLRGTPFQRAVWDALCHIPYGQAWSYARMAATIGHPRAVRAVGAANGANPVVIIVPCHRLIGSDGSLVKYGGGLSMKQYLLQHEGADLGAACRANCRKTRQ